MVGHCIALGSEKSLTSAPPLLSSLTQLRSFVRRRQQSSLESWHDRGGPLDWIGMEEDVESHRAEGNTVRTAHAGYKVNRLVIS